MCQAHEGAFARGEVFLNTDMLLCSASQANSANINLFKFGGALWRADAPLSSTLLSAENKLCDSYAN